MLKKAANYFRYSWVDGFDGTAWVPKVQRITILPFDRFISDREWGAKFRHVLADPDADSLSTYKALRTRAGQIYLVGAKMQDVRDTPYSTVYKVHTADYLGQVLRSTTSQAASGVKKGLTWAVSGTYFVDVELVSFVSSKEEPSVKFGDCHIILPRNADVTTSDEISVGTEKYQVDLVNQVHGLVYARCVRKPA